MMGRPERPLRHKGSVSVNFPGYRMNFRGFQCFFQRERRKDGRDPLGHHGLTGTGKADERELDAFYNVRFNGDGSRIDTIYGTYEGLKSHDR